MTAIYTDPLRLTPQERLYDDLLRFENRERYLAQSAATFDNARAPIPPRAALQGITNCSIDAEGYAEEQSAPDPSDMQDANGAPLNYSDLSHGF